jgi:hypothetical protein
MGDRYILLELNREAIGPRHQRRGAGGRAEIDGILLQAPKT